MCKFELFSDGKIERKFLSPTTTCTVQQYCTAVTLLLLLRYMCHAISVMFHPLPINFVSVGASMYCT